MHYLFLCNRVRPGKGERGAHPRERKHTGNRGHELWDKRAEGTVASLFGYLWKREIDVRDFISSNVKPYSAAPISWLSRQPGHSRVEALQPNFREELKKGCWMSTRPRPRHSPRTVRAT